MNIYPHVPYFYIIEHILTGKLYGGAKWEKWCNPATFMVEGGYTTNSSIVNELINAEGLEAFRTILIITDFGFDMSAYEYETIFLQTFDIANNVNWLNGHNNDRIHTAYGTKEFKNIMLAKYGVEHNSYLDSTIKKRKETSIENCGFENWMKNPDLYKEYTERLYDTQGVINVFQLESTKEISRNTCMERFGFENANQSPIIQQKSRNTRFAKTGYEHNFADPAVIKKMEDERFEKTGYRNPLSNPAVRRGILDGLSIKHNIPNLINVSQIPEISAKIVFRQSEKRKRPVSLAIEKYIKENNLIPKDIGISSHYLRQTDEKLEETYKFLINAGHVINIYNQ